MDEMTPEKLKGKYKGKFTAIAKGDTYIVHHDLPAYCARVTVTGSHHYMHYSPTILELCSNIPFAWCFVRVPHSGFTTCAHIIPRAMPMCELFLNICLA